MASTPVEFNTMGEIRDSQIQMVDTLDLHGLHPHIEPIQSLPRHRAAGHLVLE
jgi:hypothetical protein